MYPVSLLVVGEEVILQCCDLNEPTMDCLVNERSVGSPAVRIIMLKRGVYNQMTSFFKVLSNHFVSILDIYSCVVGYFACEETIIVNGDRGISRFDDTVVDTHLVVVLTKTRSRVNNTSTYLNNKRMRKVKLFE